MLGRRGHDQPGHCALQRRGHPPLLPGRGAKRRGAGRPLPARRPEPHLRRRRGGRHGVRGRARTRQPAPSAPGRGRRRHRPAPLPGAAASGRDMGDLEPPDRDPQRRPAPRRHPGVRAERRIDGVVAALEPAAVRRHRRRRDDARKRRPDRPRVGLVAVGEQEPAGRAQGGAAGERERRPGADLHRPGAGGDGHPDGGRDAGVGRRDRVDRGRQARRPDRRSAAPPPTHTAA